MFLDGFIFKVDFVLKIENNLSACFLDLKLNAKQEIAKERTHKKN